MSWISNLVKLQPKHTPATNGVLVTGATGYIGSHVCKTLKKAGFTVVGVDRNPNNVHNYCDRFITADYGDSVDMQMALMASDVHAVVHCGATSLVGPSVTNPGLYYQNNVEGTRQLLDACVAQDVKRFVFASSAATYGEADGVCYEKGNNRPCNPYGWSKWMTEQMLDDYHVAHGIRSASLRFFNVAGASGDLGQVKDATHLIARIMESALDDKEFTVYGNTYPTEDGTCVRDYVHVLDVAHAIELSLELLDFHDNTFVMNLGSGEGNSVMDIIKAVEMYTPLDVKYTVGKGRTGDPATLIASVKEAQDVLGWQPVFGLDQIVESAYNWYISDRYAELSK